MFGIGFQSYIFKCKFGVLQYKFYIKLMLWFILNDKMIFGQVPNVIPCMEKMWNLVISFPGNFAF